MRKFLENKYKYIYIYEDVCVFQKFKNRKHACMFTQKKRLEWKILMLIVETIFLTEETKMRTTTHTHTLFTGRRAHLNSFPWHFNKQSIET